MCGEISSRTRNSFNVKVRLFQNSYACAKRPIIKTVMNFLITNGMLESKSEFLIIERGNNNSSSIKLYYKHFPNYLIIVIMNPKH